MTPPIVDADSILPVSRGTTEVFKVGEWSPRRPSFAEKVSPCRAACPAGTDLPRMCLHASEGEFDRALELLLQENPLPGVCGRVCYHPCQVECNRQEFDQAVEIRAIERAVADLGHAETGVCGLSKPGQVAVIGSGPAGLAAAYFLAHFGHKVTIFERCSEAGGMLRYGIPDYRLPKDVLSREVDRILRLGVKLVTETEVDQAGFAALAAEYDAVFLSTGAWQPRRVEVPGEDLGNIVYGIDFLLSEGRELDFRDLEHVVVIGGGDVGVDAARTASRLCGPDSRVTMVAPEPRREFPALREGIDEALQEGVGMIGGYRPLAFEGTHCVEAVRLGRTQVERDPATGAYSMTPRDGKGLVLRADVVIVAVGQSPELDGLAGGFVNRHGTRVWVEEYGGTSVPGVFAAGDLVGQRASVVHAVASGKKAALAAHARLTGRRPEDIVHWSMVNGQSVALHVSDEGLTFDPTRVVHSTNLNTLFFAEAEARGGDSLPPAERKDNFREVNLGLDAGAATEEAGRCFQCGICTRCELCLLLCPDLSIRQDGAHGYRVDMDYCKGCGICSDICPRGVIETEEQIEAASHR